MTKRVVLADVKEINPEPTEFEVPPPKVGDPKMLAEWKRRFGDKVLVLKELPHTEWNRVQGRVAELQNLITPGVIPDVEKLDRASIDILLDLYKPHNPWVIREFFTPLTERYLDYLLNQGVECNQGFAREAAKDLPPSPAPPTNRAERRRSKKSTTRRSTAASS